MTPLNADLHCHSTVSDGLLAPTEVVRRAVNNGVELLALTDHDELGGLAAARAEADAQDLRFLDGVEISVSWGDQTIHIVGLDVDPSDATLSAGLANVRSGRDARAQRIGEELERIGIHGALEGAQAYAGNPALVSRAHFARFMVATGVARDTASVFEHYLTPGKPGYVEHVWATLDEAVGWIHAAGGVAVIAHPGRYRLPEAEMTRFYDHFRDLGGEGIEVVSGAHSPSQVRDYARIARRYGFAASRASDFHGVGESPVDLGRASALPPDLEPIWLRFL
ncbi:3',5'-nucleoside bisphosphate phosphatase [Uliginosibacterium sp. H1]|uniref:3',5'-nucleoside bisphosphate phosphatase n=1 Tax=Uliginosibacterium sp. H1 TaxID=3114757 RepID=UPI002E19EBD7|nr:3',5'-nucleoside bisphosphate phosphatase [Uliginosibacterium sp. H1]